MRRVSERVREEDVRECQRVRGGQKDGQSGIGAEASEKWGGEGLMARGPQIWVGEGFLWPREICTSEPKKRHKKQQHKLSNIPNINKFAAKRPNIN